jgi:drug/metabolite transporter (DMT)-like permease
MDKAPAIGGAFLMVLGLFVTLLQPVLGPFFFMLGAAAVLNAAGVIDKNEDRPLRVTDPRAWQLLIRILIGATALLMVVIAIRWLSASDLFAALAICVVAVFGFAYLILGGPPQKHSS